MGLSLEGNRRNSGFTLIELSIVIVIIGLIVAVVVGGQTLVRQAAIRSVITEMKGVDTAINLFLLQYNAIPGDMDDADDYWPTECGTITSCNGNGNKIIQVGDEGLQAWFVMNRAGVYPGSYTGLSEDPPGGNYGGKAGVNIPASKLTPGSYNLISFSSWANHRLYFGVSLDEGAANDGLSIGGILTPAEAYSLDKKNDDGVLNTGIIVSQTGQDSATTGTCNSGPADTGGYNVSNSSKRCSMRYEGLHIR